MERTSYMPNMQDLLARVLTTSESERATEQKSRETESNPETSSFDLKDIAFLLIFRDLFKDPFYYTYRITDIASVRANNSSYDVRISKKNVLFSYKLHYYTRLLESKVNQSMNEVFARLDVKLEEGWDIAQEIECTKYSIRRIVEDIHGILDILDQRVNEKDADWVEHITKYRFYDDEKDSCERIVFYHYMAAQMCRYWIELHSRYDSHLGIDEVALFYYETLQRNPDTGVFDIEQVQPHYLDAVQAPAHPKEPQPCSFKVQVRIPKDRCDMMKDLTNILITSELIAETDEKAINACFSGALCSEKIHWLGTKAELVLFIKRIRQIWITDKNPVIVSQREERRRKEDDRLVAVPKNKGLWKDIVCYWFVDKDGNPFDAKDLSKQKAPSSPRVKAGVFDAIVDAFTSNWHSN